MKLKTRDFGEVEIDKSDIIHFEDGIPAFNNLTEFVLLTDDTLAEGEVSPFVWMQSIQDEQVAFILVDMLVFDESYNPLVDEEEISGLGEYNPDDFLIYNIVVIPDDLKDATVNLKAPIVINDKKKQGKQVICKNEDYSVRHYMFK